MGIESPTHLIFIAIIALVVLGPKRLPDLARSLGNGIREFRQSLDVGAHDAPPQAPPPPAASTPPAPPPGDVPAPPPVDAAASPAAPAPSPPDATAAPDAAALNAAAPDAAAPDASRQAPASGPHEPSPPSG
jgi:sec-independent protein translocase protein TatA